MKKVILSITLIATMIAMHHVQNVSAMSEQPSTTIITGDDGFVDIKMVEQTPSADSSYVMQEEGFVDIKFEELTEKVQEAVHAIADKYDVTALTYSAEKKLTKVNAVSKEDQSEKVIYLNEEGEEVNMDAVPAEETVTEAPMVV